MANDTYDDEQEETEGMVPRSHIRDLEAKARQAEELAAKLATMERNEAFRSAGLDPADKRASYFVKGYEGDLTPEAIKAAATEAGFIADPAQQQPAGEQGRQFVPDSMERIFAASAGSQPPQAADWREALYEADRIADPLARESAILSVVERYGGTTSRTAQ